MEEETTTKNHPPPLVHNIQSFAESISFKDMFEIQSIKIEALTTSLDKALKTTKSLKEDIEKTLSSHISILQNNEKTIQNLAKTIKLLQNPSKAKRQQSLPSSKKGSLMASNNSTKVIPKKETRGRPRKIETVVLPLQEKRKRGRPLKIYGKVE